MEINSLVKVCDASVREFADKISAIDVDFAGSQSGAAWEIILNLVKIQFVYEKKESLETPTSSLFCAVRLQKNHEEIWHIPQIVHYLGLKDFRCFYFSQIESDERMKACFGVLADFIIQHLDDINGLAINYDVYLERSFEEAKRIFEIKEKVIPENLNEFEDFRLFFNFELSDFQLRHYFRFDGYQYFLQGKYNKALAKYEEYSKHNKLPFYDEQLLDFIRHLIERQESFEAVSPECASMLTAKKYDGTSKSDRMAFVIALLVSFAALTLPMMILMAVVNQYYRMTTLYCDGLGFVWAPVFTAVPTVFLAASLSNSISIRLNKNPHEALNFADLKHSSVWSKETGILAAVVMVLSLAIYGLLFQPYIKCYDEYMIVNVTEEFLPEYKRFEYKDVRAIYHVDGRYNVYGDYIDRSSYILRFDECDIDTDGYMFSEEAIQNEFLPLFDQYIERVQYVDTDKDIE